MFEIITVVLFCWLFYKALCLAFKVSWGLAKAIAVILFVLALPTLIGGLFLATGVMLLLPVAVIACAWGILGLAHNA